MWVHGPAGTARAGASVTTHVPYSQHSYSIRDLQYNLNKNLGKDLGLYVSYAPNLLSDYKQCLGPNLRWRVLGSQTPFLEEVKGARVTVSPADLKLQGPRISSYKDR